MELIDGSGGTLAFSVLWEFLFLARDYFSRNVSCTSETYGQRLLSRSIIMAISYGYDRIRVSTGNMKSSLYTYRIELCLISSQILGVSTKKIHINVTACILRLPCCSTAGQPLSKPRPASRVRARSPSSRTSAHTDPPSYGKPSFPARPADPTSTGSDSP